MQHGVTGLPQEGWQLEHRVGLEPQAWPPPLPASIMAHPGPSEQNISRAFPALLWPRQKECWDCALAEAAAPTITS